LVGVSVMVVMAVLVVVVVAMVVMRALAVMGVARWVVAVVWRTPSCVPHQWPRGLQSVTPVEESGALRKTSRAFCEKIRNQ
jgi:hypothetical protein